MTLIPFAAGDGAAKASGKVWDFLSGEFAL